MVIQYRGNYSLLNCLLFAKDKGSVFPNAFAIALPSALIAAGLKVLMEMEYWESKLGLERTILNESAVWSGFNFLVGFLTVFRTSQAYDRFWSGCTATHSMRAEWFDACASCLAFCKHSLESPKQVTVFQHTLVRLFSMLHAVALAEIEDCESDDPSHVNAFHYPLIDVGGIDGESLETLRESDCKVELVFQWIQQFITENIRTNILSIPPPLLSRTFDELANGMVFFHDAMKISTIPFPFPYAQTCHWLLALHWFMTPVVCAHWVSTPAWCFVFAFIQVFVLWTLNLIAVEIENPFGRDANDIDASQLQQELNAFLLQLVSAKQWRTPRLTERARSQTFEPNAAIRLTLKRGCLLSAWVGGDPTMSQDSGLASVASEGAFEPGVEQTSQATSAYKSGAARGAMAKSIRVKRSASLVLDHHHPHSSRDSFGSSFGRVASGQKDEYFGRVATGQESIDGNEPVSPASPYVERVASGSPTKDGSQRRSSPKPSPRDRDALRNGDSRSACNSLQLPSMRSPSQRSGAGSHEHPQPPELGQSSLSAGIDFNAATRMYAEHEVHVV
mmetsp:Transcript_17900/g.41739  ORF Transcript_17900/g.41739 Transcript_17900/m.41739 type:complete len:561 (+) Transcript_17900:76-1758(+)|eukprot:CAMPEP_0178397122 /NCGR_PEP_ID=MMETSP0689_2-20121128/14081_1 /TAXON_ID=160604 /ORGANISM="Amphidinium massartii, Strain CS-259" /LENGTH=560 /DNA_ID=CAMNT_0020017817 /DNA_START=62 /DNA_END=1744 /DNA_ORIENTATION=+